MLTGSPKPQIPQIFAAFPKREPFAKSVVLKTSNAASIGLSALH